MPAPAKKSVKQKPIEAAFAVDPADAARQAGLHYVSDDRPGYRRKANGKAMGTVLLIILVLLLIGPLPAWPYSSAWAYRPSGGLGLILLVILVLALMGHI